MSFRYDIKNKEFKVTELDWKKVENRIGKLNNNRATWQSVEDGGIQNTGLIDGNGRPIYTRTFRRYQFTPKGGKQEIGSETFTGVGQGGDFRNENKRKEVVAAVEALQKSVNEWNETYAENYAASNQAADVLISKGKEQIRGMQNTNRQYQNVLNQAKKTKSGDYLANFNTILKQKGFDQLDDKTNTALKESFKDFTELKS